LRLKRELKVQERRKGRSRESEANRTHKGEEGRHTDAEGAHVSVLGVYLSDVGHPLGQVGHWDVVAELVGEIGSLLSGTLHLRSGIGCADVSIPPQDRS
jgi:hypothetical protein